MRVKLILRSLMHKLNRQFEELDELQIIRQVGNREKCNIQSIHKNNNLKAARF